MPALVTVTATVQDPSGTALAGNSFVRFRLRNFAGFVPQISGTSIMPEIQVDATPTAGLISQALWPNNAITPSTTFYTVELWNQGRITSSGNYIFNANTSLNSAAQVNTPPVPAGFNLVLENNGVLNSSQSTLNLESTDASVTITDLGSGNINLKAATGSAFATSGQGFFIGPGLDNSALISNTTGFLSTGGGSGPGANSVLAVQFVLQSSWTISSVSYKASITSGGSHFNFGIYSAAGNRLIDSGSFDGSISTLQTNTFGAVTLPPGVYYFASSATSTTITGVSLNVNVSDIADLRAVMGSLWSVAANATSANVMPPTLGTLTPVGSSFVTIPTPVWKV